MASQLHADRLQRASAYKQHTEKKKKPHVRRHSFTGSTERANFDNWWHTTAQKKEAPGFSESEHDTRPSGSRRQTFPDMSLSVSEHGTFGSMATSVRLKGCIITAERPNPESERSRPTRRKTVKFHEVEIREFERIPGDNPSCAAGPAISMAWDYHDVASLDVHEYEKSRPPRRNKYEIQMPAATRTKLLQKTGHSPQDIQRARDEIDRERRIRSTSAALQEFETLQIAKESVGRKLKRWMKGKKSSKDEDEDEQEELWKKANKGNKTALERKARPGKAPPATVTTPETSLSSFFEEGEEEMA